MDLKAFQSPRTGKFESNNFIFIKELKMRNSVFQSPRTGKFESNSLKNALKLTMGF